MTINSNPIHILYFGTTKLVALRGSMTSEGVARVDAFCRCPAHGFSQGTVSDLDKAGEQLHVLLRNFLPKDETTKPRFSVILATPSLRGYFFNSSVYFGDYPKVIQQSDIQRVIAQTRTVATIPLDEMIIHAVPQEYIVNDLGGIKNPLGMEGRRLGVTLLLFSVKMSVLKNLNKILEKNDLAVDRFVPKAMASSLACLKEDERKDGVTLMDVGGYTTDVVYFKNGDLLTVRTLECGAEEITSALVEKWSIPSREARRLKEKFGSCRIDQAGDELIPIKDLSGNVRTHISRLELCETIREATTKLLHRIQPVMEEIRSDYKQIASVVVTGGGALLDGFAELVQENWQFPVRMGLVQKIQGPQEVLLGSAQYSAALGLLSDEYRKRDEEQRVLSAKGFISKTLLQAREWIEEYF
jgi:cell division protein FtsA